MKKLFLIIVLAAILSLTVSCIQKNDIAKSQNNGTQYFVKADLVNYNAIENEEEINDEEQFEVQLREFYDFTQEFFPIWDKHIKETTEIFDKFNNINTSHSDKIICSTILIEKYKKFSDDLNRINPPLEASKAYDFSLNSISKRILFFEEFKRGTSVQELIEIGKEANFYETLFWDEIDKIFEYYLGKMDKTNNIQV
jgi:hypothetical protein